MRYSTTNGKQIDYAFWLVFGRDGSVRLTRAQPSAGRGERAMSCRAVLPMSLFRTPELKATIVLDEATKSEFKIDVRAASEALKGVIGVDVDLQVVPS